MHLMDMQKTFYELLANTWVNYEHPLAMEEEDEDEDDDEARAI